MRNIRKQLPEGVDAHQVCRVVQWCKLTEFLDMAYDFIIDQSRIIETSPFAISFSSGISNNWNLHNYHTTIPSVPRSVTSLFLRLMIRLIGELECFPQISSLP